MSLMEFSMIPLDKGPHFSPYVARILTIVADSGLPYKLNPMGTVVEGTWEECTDLLTRCMKDLEKDSERISLSVKFDHRPSVKNALECKIKSVENVAHRRFNV